MKKILTCFTLFACLGNADNELTLREILVSNNLTGPMDVVVRGGTDKDTTHSYIEPYSELLEPLRNKKINLLEIGVSEGGSALLWHEFLPLSQIFLIDCRKVMYHTICEALNPERITYNIMDAYTQDTINTIKTQCPDGFDVIIDDGPHTLESQLFCIENYLDLLNPGGILVIEDIQCAEVLPFLSDAVPINDGYSVEIIDLRKVKGRYDDILFVARKNPK